MVQFAYCGIGPFCCGAESPMLQVGPQRASSTSATWFATMLRCRALPGPVGTYSAS